MPRYNRVILVGNLTRDPRLKRIPSGEAVTDLGLATSEKYKNRDGELSESVCFVDIVAWGRQAESCARYLTKGAPVLVEGKLQFDQWQAQDGSPRNKLRVRASRIQFLGRPGGGAEGRETVPGEQTADPIPF